MKSTQNFLLMMALLVLTTHAFSQQPADTVKKSSTLKEVRIKAWQRTDVAQLPDEQDGFIASGKKSEVITLGGTNANIAIKTARQVFAKVPGVFVYDMDGSGNQLNIATRGLDPHRSWEFNNRQNGVMINSDIYGYPASHYSAPMESIEKVEVLRGTGSLQYGSQFGGMVNFTTKRSDSAKVFGLESMNTLGSFGLMSSYTAIGGTHKKFSYYAYYHRRHSDGYRKNSESSATAQFVQLGYRFSNAISLRAELGRSTYQYHIPGPLNDSLFAANPRQSTRSRNYFSPDIYVPSLTLNVALSPATKFNLTASGVFGVRNSVQLDAFATVLDTINRATGQYRNRQVDIDNFNSKTLEGRLVHTCQLGSVQSRLAAGFAYSNNDLHRRQQGRGTTGTDYDLSVEGGAFGRDLHFKSNNIALFAENAFSFTPRWTVSPGIRFENGQSDMSGTISYYTVNPLPTTIKHNFVLLGLSTNYRLGEENMFYGGISQAYRPVIFKDIIPASVYEQIDKDLKDGFGYNAEAGIRGKWGKLQYDVNYFTVLYKNRLGTLVQQDGAAQPYIFRTNVGDSRTKGVEAFLQYKFPLSSSLYAGLFTSTAYMNARYIKGQVADAGTNKSIVGNQVEAAPEWISRNGLEVLFKGFSATVLYSYTSSSFSDALNTITPPATGARGFTPGYGIWDINASFRFTHYFSLRAGVGNVFDRQYFTKRPTFYPGPGIWPSDGRNAYLTVGVRI